MKVFPECLAFRRQFLTYSSSERVCSPFLANRGANVSGPAQDAPLYQPREELYKLQDICIKGSNIKVLHLTQDMGGTLEVYASEFKPLPSDKTAYEWDDSTGRHKMETPTYALTRLLDIKTGFLCYVEKNERAYLAELHSFPKIIQDTLKLAESYSKSKPVSSCHFV
jgi:hypothetical protein